MSARLDVMAAARKRSSAVARMRALASGAGQAPLERTGGLSVPGAEHCDICRTALPDDHRIVCACEACWALHSGDPEYRPAGTRTVWLQRFDLDEELWARFQIPIGLAFLMRSTVTGGVVAFYPSPAGATESELELDAWDELVERNPILAGLDPDAEALILNRLADPPQFAIAPIDRCYALVGLIKTRWEGISGGAALSEAVPQFFASLRAEAVNS
jgi:hypothetical protein